MTAPRDLTSIAADLIAADPDPADSIPCRQRLEAIKRRLLNRPGLASGEWRNMHTSLRAVLLSLCTDRRDPQRDAAQGWEAFTPAERAAIGATARTWAQQLAGARTLR